MNAGPSFILQTTRAGRLPTNAIISEEGAALEETLKASKSGEFERIVLLRDSGTVRHVMFDSAKAPPPEHGDTAAPKPLTADRGRAPLSGPPPDMSAWSRKASRWIVGGMILAVIAFAIDYALNP